MPTFKDNALDTRPLDIEQIVNPKKGKGKKVAPELTNDLSAFQGVADVGTHKVKIEDPKDEWTLMEATFGSLGRGLQTSMVGTSVRSGMESGSVLSGLKQFFPDVGMTYDLDEEDITSFMNSDIDVSAIPALIKSVDSKQAFQDRLATMMENQKMQTETAKQGITGMVFNGLGDAVGDPTSYVPLFGQAGAAAKTAPKLIKSALVSKMGQSAVVAGMSEGFLRNNITGQEADIGGAMLGGAAFAGVFHGIGRGYESLRNRIDSSETARNSNLQDPTVRPNHKGSRADLDDDTEILESGKVITRGIVPKASSDLRGGLWRDNATQAHMSDNPDVREMAASMARPTQGYKGSAAEVGTTMEDVHRTLTARDNNYMTDYREAMDAVTERSAIINGRGNLAQRQQVSRQVRHAIEGHIDEASLPASVQKLVKAARDFFDNKADQLANPSQMTGRIDVPPIMEKFLKNYVPHVWNSRKTQDFINLHGRDKAHELLKQSFLKGYHMAPDSKDEFDDIIMKHFKKKEGDVTPELVERYINDKTYGIIAGDAPMTRSLLDSGENTGDLDFMKHRMPFSTMGEVQMPDGSIFKADDLLDDNLEQIMSSYSKNVNGRVAITSVSGMSASAFGSKLQKMPDSEAKKGMVELFKTIKGIQRRDYTMSDVVADTVSDLTFASNNGGMPIVNLFEVLGKGLARQGYMKAAANHFKRALGKEIKDMSPGDIATEFGTAIAGQHITQRMNLQFSDWLDGQAARMQTKVDELTGAQKAALGTKYASSVYANWHPMTRLLDRSQAFGIKMGNDVAMAEIISHATGKGKSSMFSDGFLKSNSISREVADDVLDFVKGIMKDYDAAGKPVEGGDWLKQTHLSNPRMANVVRFMNALNDEMLAKSTNVGQQYYKPLGAIGRLFTQFKRFSIGSTQYLTKTVKDIGQLHRLDASVALIGSTASTYFVTNGMAALKGSMISNDKERKEYLKENLSPDAQLAATLRRLPQMAGFAMAMDLGNIIAPVPYAGLGKTTGSDVASEALSGKPSTGFGDTQRMGQQVMSMFPAARTVGAASAVVKNSVQLGADLMDDTTIRKSESARIQRAMARDIRGLVIGNNPFAKSAFDTIMKNATGIDPENKK